MFTLAALQTAQLSPPAIATAVNLWLATALMVVGVVVHFVQKMAELEDAGQIFTPLGYLRLHPWRAAALVTSAWGLLWVCFATGELSRVTAFLIGYSCQAAADVLRARANAKASQ
jgi:hypothetical protein